MFSFSSCSIIYETDQYAVYPRCFDCRLQIRLNEILKENKEFRSTSSLLEHKVDELTEENGVLSSQVLTHLLALFCVMNLEVKREAAVFADEDGVLPAGHL